MEKPCAYFLGYTVGLVQYTHGFVRVCFVLVVSWFVVDAQETSPVLFRVSQTNQSQQKCGCSGLIPGIGSTNERRRYIATASLIGGAHSKADLCMFMRHILYTLLAKKVVTPPLKTIKPMWIELLCFHLAEIGMIWTRDCSPTKSDTTLGRYSMQGQVGSSSSETTV